MGVQGLWKLLECSGRPINPESLEGKILAVDISIWLNQAVKGARDRHGNSIPNAHLLTLFHRLCKLLFFRIRPVFVFDGEAPLLKMQTLARRRQRKEVAATDSKKTTEKLLKTFLKRQAIKSALAGKSTAEFPSLSEIRREEVDDIYVLPSLQEDRKNSSEEEDEKEWEERMTQKKILQEELIENPHSVDVESEDFQSLPAEVKHEILSDMKEFTKRRRTLFETMPEESNDFSQYQLKGLLKKSSLNRHIEKVEKEMNEQHAGDIQSRYEEDGGFLKEVETKRVVSEDTSHYILIKGIQSKREVSRDLATASASQSSMPEDTKPSLNASQTLVNVSSSSYVPSKTESMSSTYPAPPSPRTVLAIQTAMLGSSSEDELEDKNKNQSDLAKQKSDPSIDASNVSPRTLRAIQKALYEEEDDEDIRPSFTSNVGSSQEETPSVKDLLANSSDEESQVPEGQSGKELPFLPTGQSEYTNINQEKQVDQRNCVLGKDQSVPESPCSLFVEKGISSVSDDKEKGVEMRSSKIDVSYIQSESTSSDMQQPIRSSTDTPQVARMHSHLAEIIQNGKVEQLRELVHQPGQSASVVQHECSFTSEIAKMCEEKVEAPSQSEESESDGSFIEVDAERSEEFQDETHGMSLTSSDQMEEAMAKAALDIRGGSDGSMESLAEYSGEDVEIQQEAEIKDKEDATVNEWQDISMEELEVLEKNLSVEQNTLHVQKKQQERIAATVTGQMFLESQELLRLFGIPYIEAPMEAEAQCAILDLTDQTSGTITDDSDIWLFGARHVYKNFFSQNKYVEYYQYVDFQNQLGLDRNKLINLAYLLGSDYTEGIPNVGYVTAMEILNEFPGRGLEPLLKLTDWWAEAQTCKKTQPNPYDTKVKKKLRQLQLTPGFPNPAVAEAYLHPVVDESKGSFVWGRPDLEQIREFCQSHFGWTKLKTDEVLLPVLKQLNAQQTQLRIDSFFRLAQQEKQAIKSQRVRRAVTCMKRKEKEEEETEVLQATAIIEEEFKKRKRKKPRQDAEQETGVIQSHQGKRIKHSSHTNQSFFGGGFIGEIQLSEASSGSSAEDLENEILNSCKREKTAEMLKTDTASHKTNLGLELTRDEAGSSSSSEEEKMPMVRARPVFEGRKARSKSSRGRRRK
ncbi:LOW QUALITY PROTEIN: DNA excision repair protein ERCC-5-like [Sceloporus undulatus]|uniref:LOW QUALITY PROTEIN: DNA excision repair protein ERCC-5-like n=1 Tax=Sceloporus undulatus TaxID=8520 RepID=UPI001C4AA26D|nr:LOW QUALITY PROTEIN: DNA excision repair protein ERCC-5-like [Sceloporus undulatus]